MDESIHTIEKLRKASENVGFEDERHIELRMELVWHIGEAGALIKEKYSFINKMETRVHYLEEDNHISESPCCKSIQDMG